MVRVGGEKKKGGKKGDSTILDISKKV